MDKILYLVIAAALMLMTAGVLVFSGMVSLGDVGNTTRYADDPEDRIQTSLPGGAEPWMTYYSL